MCSKGATSPEQFKKSSLIDDKIYIKAIEQIKKIQREYIETDDKEDIIRVLMQESDTLLKKFEEQNISPPKVLEELDDKLWKWFSEPPEPEEFEKVLNIFLKELTAFIETGKSKPQEQKEIKTQEQEENVSSSSDSDNLIIEFDVEEEIINDFLKEANEQIEKIEMLISAVEKKPDKNLLNELFRCFHTLKGGFGFCELNICTKLVHSAEDLMGNLRENPPKKIPSSWIDLLFAVLDAVKIICAQLEKAVAQNSNQLKLTLSEEYLIDIQTDLGLACKGETRKENFRSLSKYKETESQTEDIGIPTVQIELNKIDEVVDLVGELVISQSALRNIIGNNITPQIDSCLTRTEKIMNALQRSSMKLRMLPLKKEFNKFHRIVRDLARDLNKEVELYIYGGETELDKSVLDALHGPLVHLVRNSIDHGIETVEERKKLSKPERGKLILRAYHESGNVFVEVEDDGRGLNREKIIKKAIERGIIEKGEGLSNEEIDRLIFHPGFSTADNITDISGRGVGMDVVLKEIEKVRGEIFIYSQPLKGTKISIKLPLTVAIINGLIAYIGKEKVIFPVNQIVEAINPRKEDFQWVQGHGLIVHFRNSAVPVIIPEFFIDEKQKYKKIINNWSIGERAILIVVKTYQGEFAIYVDKLLSHEQVVIKSLTGAEVERSELFSGAAILGDGEVGLILNIDGFIREYQEARRKEKVQVSC